MIKSSSSQNGSAFVAIIIVLLIAIIGALGFVFWQNFIQSPDTPVNQENLSRPDKTAPAPLCAGGSDTVEQNGIFCSESIGVEFKIPEVFAGKFQKKENYDVYQGPRDSSKKSPAGKSLEYYEAVVTSGQETLETLSLSVAKEPLRSGYTSVAHALQWTYFDATTGNLYTVVNDKLVPSFNVTGTKIYRGQAGDAGVVEDGYLMVVNGYLVIIKIKHVANPMDTPVLDNKKPFEDLYNYLKQLKVLKEQDSSSL